MFNPATCFWSACTKTCKWAVIYLCVKGVDSAPFYNFFFNLKLFLQCGFFGRFHFIRCYFAVYIRYQNFPYEPSLDVSIRPHLFVYGYYQFIRRYIYGSLLNFTSFCKLQHRDNKIDKSLLWDLILNRKLTS